MNTRAEFNVGPLSWVKGEIDLAMQRSLEALRAFASSPEDAARIKLSQKHLHQAHGALSIVGLDGVTRVSEELEALLVDLEKGAVPPSEEMFTLAERAFDGIVGYLDQLIAGRPNQPLRLFPLYRALLAGRGQKQADPTDLYFPDLSFRPPRRHAIPVVPRPGEEQRYLREQRSRYQRGFLRFLKNDPAGVQDMRGAVEAIELTQGLSSQRAFWWVSLAFFDALLNKALAADLDVKRMCNRVEQQIKRLVEGSQSVAERLMREALYYVARARPVNAHVRLVQDTYHVAQTVPPDDAGDAQPAQPPALKPARELVSQAKDAWNKFASGNPPSLLAFRDASGALKESAENLGNDDVESLAAEVSALCAWLIANKDKMSEAVALEVATALLLLENALVNFDGLGAEFSQQSQLICSRLRACVAGKLLRTQPEIQLLDEMSRKAQERLLMSQVVSEMQANLRAIEQALDAFFRDSSRRDGLKALDTPLKQVLGALDMLGEERARDTLGAADLDIRRFAEARYEPSQNDFERIAQTLSGLGFYIEALAHGKADFDAAMRPIAPPQPAADMDVQQPAIATFEAQLAEQKRETASLYEEWKKTPEDAALKAELQKNLAALQQDAGLVADQKLEASAEEALQALDNLRVAPQEPKLADALGKISPTPAAPSPEAAKLIDASAETIDAELLAVYLEEANQVLATIRANLASVRSQHVNKDALTIIRRGFHTLKGSGHMVGLMHLGDAAWALEKALNQWLQEEHAATPELLELINAALEYFGDSVARLKAGGGSGDHRALIALADQVRAGAGFAAEGAVSPPPPEPEEFVLPPEPEESVLLGEHRVSTTLFTIFSGEARAHLGTISEEHETLRQHGVVTDALLRATHTLAGISGTVKLDALRDLGYAFEYALQQMAANTLSEEEQALVGDTIDTIEDMVSAAIGLSLPAPVPELVARLRRIGSQRPEPEIIVPEEEGALAREPRSREPPSAREPLPGEPQPVRGLPPVGPPLTREPGSAEEVQAGHPAEGLEVEEIPLERRTLRLDDEIDPQVLPVFLEEAQELVPAVAEALREWRSAPDHAELGQALQRLLHTLKGSARMAGAMAMGELTHYMETRIENALPQKTLPAGIFEELESSNDRLGLLYERLLKPDEAEVPDFAAAPAPEAPVEAAPRPAVPREEVAPRVALLRVRADVVDRLVNQAGEVSIARSRIEGEMRLLKTAMQELTDNVVRLRAQLREIEIQAESQMQSNMELARETKAEFDPLEFDRFTRFQELTRMMAESVSDVQTVHQNLVHAVDETEKGLGAQARLNRELQQDLMRVRMVPFASLSERLYRIVRQTAKELGKRANLDIRGTQVELDRSVLERITAPFEHLLRNAITHGIEAPAARMALGKSTIGEISLELAQENNEVRLVLADDGAGLDIERIKARALEQGLMGPWDALSEAQIAHFIFLPGFTTASEVSRIAGRGVGMDVVRSEITALGGRIELKFTKNQGTRFTIFLPLTLAVTQVLLVRAGSRTCAIPAAMVEQVMQLRQDKLDAAYQSHKIEWQDREFPFHYLPHLLGAGDAVGEHKRFSPVLFLRSGTHSISLHVDEMLGSNQEIVVKAIGPQLQRIAGITGATVLGSGAIVLILNPVQLAQRALSAPAAAREATQPPAAETQPTVMVVDDSLTVRKVAGRMLERQGYLVVTAKDGVEAMEKLQELVPDVMLVDIEMPRMDGFDLTRNVRADKRLGGVPIIMVTSRTADKHQNYARQIGVNAFIGKPYQEEELLGHIRGFIAERAAA